MSILACSGVQSLTFFLRHIYIGAFCCHKHGVTNRPDTPGTAAQEARDAAFDTSNYIRSYHVSFLLSSTLYSFLESIFGFPSVIATQFAESLFEQKKIHRTKNQRYFQKLRSAFAMRFHRHRPPVPALFKPHLSLPPPALQLATTTTVKNRYHLQLAFITCCIIFRCSKLFYEHHCSLFQSPQ